MTGQAHASAPPRKTLRRLAELRSEGGGVLSVYIDLDPSVFPNPPERQTQIDSIVSEAEQAFTDGKLPNEEVERRKSAVERVREALNDDEVVKGGVRAVAVFAAPNEDVFEVVRLDAPLAPAVVVDDTPYLRPLADEAGPRTWVFLLTDRRNARVLYGGPRKLVEIASFSDDNVRSRPSYGGWSQARYERGHEEAAREHFETAIEIVEDFFGNVRFDALAIAAPDPLYDEVVAKLPSSLAERLRGRIRVEIDFPSPGQVLEAVAPIFEEARTKVLDDILDSLEERSRELVAIGTEDVLRALHEQRVMTLVIGERFEASGVRCPQCNWLGLSGSECPYDNTKTEERPDITDDAIDMAFMQAAQVVQIPVDSERQPPEPLSALLRF